MKPGSVAFKFSSAGTGEQYQEGSFPASEKGPLWLMAFPVGVLSKHRTRGESDSSLYSSLACERCFWKQKRGN